MHPPTHTYATSEQKVGWDSVFMNYNESINFK